MQPLKTFCARLPVSAGILRFSMMNKAKNIYIIGKNDSYVLIPVSGSVSFKSTIHIVFTQTLRVLWNKIE